MRLAIVAIGVLEVGRRVIPGAVFQLDFLTIAAHRDLAIAAVARLVGAAIADDVIRGRILLHAIEDFAEIVGIQKRLAAGIVRHRVQGLLGLELRVELIANCLP